MPRVPCGASGRRARTRWTILSARSWSPIGDEDLLPGDPVAAVAFGHGPRLERADVGARLRLGQVHRAGPFAGDQLRQPGLLQFGRAMMLGAPRPRRASASCTARSPCSPSRDPPSPPSPAPAAAPARRTRAARRASPSRPRHRRDRPRLKPGRHGDALGRPLGADLVADPVRAARTRPRRRRPRLPRSRRPGPARLRRRRCGRPAPPSRRRGGAGISVLRRAARRSWRPRTLRGWNGGYSARL